MKIFNWIRQNLLFVLTLILLVFIPLYPKLPLIDIKNTWVYIRVEDFLVFSALFVWLFALFRKKVTLKTPLTLPILVFWLVGAIATIHAVIVIFPSIANVFSNVAFLSYIRRIEYLSVFFVAYAGMRDKRFIKYIIATLVITLIAVVVYGIGQRYLGFPAFLTMNEEFAKGIPIKLSAMSRVPSTFAGHYDLAAYLVLVIPILASLFFAFRNLVAKSIFLLSSVLGVVLLFMTVSRVSFFVLLISLIFVLIFHHKKKFILLSIPILGLLIAVVSLGFSQSLLSRFGSTVKEVNVLVDAKTGLEIGQVRTVPNTEVVDKLVRQQTFVHRDQLNIKFRDNTQNASISAIPETTLPKNVLMVIPPQTSTGESLPQGSGYINLSLSPVVTRSGDFFYEKPKVENEVESTESARLNRYYGQFLVKRVAAYDLSFTTRYQGEWPNAFKAFKRNILFGSGYSSVSLAVDNDFLRMLAEVGLLGFAAFISIFLFLGIYIKKVLPDVDSKISRGFILGFAAGMIGLSLNALLIDVFEASKVAYTMWLLTGVTVGLLKLYQKTPVSLKREFKKALSSQYAIVIYIFIISVTLYSPMIKNYFVGDDFTWLRWAADCHSGMSTQEPCPSTVSRVLSYFTNSDGFFYRPGTKVYFHFMYSVFWLNQSMYHLASILLHSATAIVFYLLSRKILKNNAFASFGTFLFLMISGYTEEVFWIASTGHLFNAMFILLSLLFFVYWEEQKKLLFLVVSLISAGFSLMFHELGVVVPVMVLVYKLIEQNSLSSKIIIKNMKGYALFLLPVVLYLLIRLFAQSHWFSGDYNYNLFKLPFNILGNIFGYFMLAVFGPIWLSFYEPLRGLMRQNLLPVSVALLTIFAASAFFIRSRFEKLKKVWVVSDLHIRKTVFFGLALFVIFLLPFLGLGNITSRYSYLASCGAVLLFVVVLKAVYSRLMSYGKEIGIVATSMIISVFILFHLMQLQQVHSDWFEAGKKTENFVISMDSLYDDYWSVEHMSYHFVNTPIKHGDAWIFPVGLNDAMWLIFRNSNIEIFQDSSLEVALSSVEGYRNEKIFVFSDDGSVDEIRRIKNTNKYYQVDKN